MPRPSAPGVHLVVGGYPPGSTAGHDMGYVRMRLLELVAEVEHAQPTISSDFGDIESWLPTTQLLLTYTSGPFPAPAQAKAIDEWLERGGRWFALHGTSGGKAVSVDGDRRRRAMVRLDHHNTLGAFFLNHPPLRQFTVDVVAEHPITAGLGSTFDTADELYFVEVLDPDAQILLTTHLPEDPDPAFGFEVADDTSVRPDGSRVLGLVREQGDGAVAYVALGHSHSPATNSQTYVDASVHPEGTSPPTFRGSWESEAFITLVRNGITWGLTTAS
jgi:uncharacterized protein